MRGFQSANDVRRGELLREALASDPNHVYSGLLTDPDAAGVRAVRRGPRPALQRSPCTRIYYSVTGLFERLREDAGRFPDTMNQRLRRLVPADHPVPADLRRRPARRASSCRPRKGYLFDPRKVSLPGGKGYVVSCRLSVAMNPLHRQLTTDNRQLFLASATASSTTSSAKPADPGRRAAQLPHVGCRADWQRLRDGDGLQPGGGRAASRSPFKSGQVARGSGDGQPGGAAGDRQARTAQSG